MKIKEETKLLSELADKIDFRILQLHQRKEHKEYAFDGIYWAEDDQGNKYWEAFGKTANNEKDYLMYSEIKEGLKSLARFVSKSMINKETTFNKMMDNEGNLFTSKEGAIVPITEIYLDKPKDWPDMDEPPYIR